MHINSLARYYDAFSARERFALMVAARLRGDLAEAECLIRSAPTGVFRVPDFRGLAEVLGELSALHRVRLLDAAARLWHLDSLRAGNLQLSRRGEERQQRDFRLGMLLRQQAYLFLIEREAWQRFCAELQLDAEALLRDLPGGDTLAQTEQSARALAFSVEEAARAAQMWSGDDAAVITVEDVLADYQAALAQQEHRWKK